MDLMIYRHFSLLIRNSLFAIAAGTVVFIGAGCRGAKTPREQIAGIWEFTGMHITGRVVYRGDGTVINLFPEDDTARSRWVPTGVGKWWIDGNSIVTEVKNLAQMDEPPRITRAKVAFTPDKLLSADGHSDSIRVTPAIARSSEIATILRGLAALVIVAYAVTAATKTVFRRAFAIIGAGAACLTASSILAIPQEFAQTGDLVVSAATLRALQVPRDFFESAALVLIAAGVVFLTMSMRREKANREGDG
jgi:hypothetical protein